LEVDVLETDGRPLAAMMVFDSAFPDSQRVDLQRIDGGDRVLPSTVAQRPGILRFLDRLILRQKDLWSVEARVGDDREVQEGAPVDSGVPARDIRHRWPRAPVLHDGDLLEVHAEADQVEAQLADRDRVAVEGGVDAALEVAAQR